MEEPVQIWATILEFPEYEVSNWGLIFSKRRRVVLNTTRNNHGHVRISLTNHLGRFTRSVSVLVATAFVPAHDSLCDTVVMLDGDKTNLNADNLVWRPRGFAWEYVRQLRNPTPRHFVTLSVVNVITGAEYENIEVAAKTEGLLYKDIWRSIHHGSPCYPGGCCFEVTQRV